MGKDAALIVTDTEASRVMLERVRLMAMFINDYDMAAFAAYWKARYPGKADPTETVNYWAHNDLENTLVLGRKTT